MAVSQVLDVVMGSVMSQEYRNTHQDAMFHLIVDCLCSCSVCLFYVFTQTN